MTAKKISKPSKARNVLRVALYVRVSTQEQANEGYSIGEQTERLKSYCKAMGWTIHKIYTDPGYSGGDTHRPGLKDLIKDVESGLVDKVVVYKLDRLSRSQKDTLILIEDVFLDSEVDFVSMSENFDTSTPIGRAVLGLLAVFAQLERDQIRERMSMGKEARAKQGKWNGGATEPIGYDYDNTKDLLVKNNYEIMQYLELVDLFLERTPLRTIETEFYKKGYKHKHGYWTPKAMRRVLNSKLYLGYMHYKGEWYKAEHDAVINQETYDKIQALLKEREDNYKSSGIIPHTQTTYLGGLLYCKHCGGRYAKQENSRRKEGKPLVYWYMCYSRSKKVKAMIKDPTCKNKNWKMNELDDIVFNEIKKLAMYPDYISKIKTDKAIKADTPNKIEVIEKEIAKLDEQISRFMDLYGIGKFDIEQVSQKVDPLNESRNSLLKELEALNAESGRLSVEEAQKIVESFSDILDGGDFEEIRTVIEMLIYYIEIDNDIVRIHWKFA
jgi:site-specific DNA recombinase